MGFHTHERQIRYGEKRNLYVLFTIIKSPPHIAQTLDLTFKTSDMILQNVFLLDDILYKPRNKIHIIGSRMVLSDLRKNDYLRYVA